MEKLPYNLLADICSQLQIEGCTYELCSLAITCRKFTNIAQPQLFVAVKLAYPTFSYMHMYRTLTSKPYLAARMKRLDLTIDYNLVNKYDHTILGSFSALMKILSHNECKLAALQLRLQVMSDDSEDDGSGASSIAEEIENLPLEKNDPLYCHCLRTLGTLDLCIVSLRSVIFELLNLAVNVHTLTIQYSSFAEENEDQAEDTDSSAENSATSLTNATNSNNVDQSIKNEAIAKTDNTFIHARRCPISVRLYNCTGNEVQYIADYCGESLWSLIVEDLFTMQGNNSHLNLDLHLPNLQQFYFIPNGCISRTEMTTFTQSFFLTTSNLNDILLPLHCNILEIVNLVPQMWKKVRKFGFESISPKDFLSQQELIDLREALNQLSHVETFVLRNFIDSRAGNGILRCIPKHIRQVQLVWDHELYDDFAHCYPFLLATMVREGQLFNFPANLNLQIHIKELDTVQFIYYDESTDDVPESPTSGIVLMQQLAFPVTTHVELISNGKLLWEKPAWMGVIGRTGSSPVKRHVRW